MLANRTDPKHVRPLAMLNPSRVEIRSSPGETAAPRQLGCPAAAPSCRVPVLKHPFVDDKDRSGDRITRMGLARRMDEI